MAAFSPANEVYISVSRFESTSLITWKVIQLVIYSYRKHSSLTCSCYLHPNGSLHSILLWVKRDDPYVMYTHVQWTYLFIFDASIIIFITSIHLPHDYVRMTMSTSLICQPLQIKFNSQFNSRPLKLLCSQFSVLRLHRNLRIVMLPTFVDYTPISL